jgi:glycosyltransferase involved in cell wall biosynthesis
LTRALAGGDVEVTFVLPKKMDISSSFVRLEFADTFLPNVTVRAINSLLKPYLTSQSYLKQLRGSTSASLYGLTLMEEVKLYALRAAELAETLEFDIIHAHDWLSFGAGLAAKHVSGKPLVVHVHATEFDRTGGSGVNPEVYEMERRGMQEADAVITVSDFTKRLVVDRYGIFRDKVRVIHNGIDPRQTEESGTYAKRLAGLKSSGKKIALFVGRITLQKGPDYFLRAAKRVLEYHPDVYFVIAGSGDMEWQAMREAAWLGISNKVIFAGFLRGDELDGLYRTADVFVMPSVSEPFGLTALEAVGHGTPVILSKQSGVSEVIQHAIKVDFWDTDAMANAISGVLYHEPLRSTMRENASRALKGMNWGHAAALVITLYKQLL